MRKAGWFLVAAVLALTVSSAGAVSAPPGAADHTRDQAVMAPALVQMAQQNKQQKQQQKALQQQQKAQQHQQKAQQQNVQRQQKAQQQNVQRQQKAQQRNNQHQDAQRLKANQQNKRQEQRNVQRQKEQGQAADRRRERDQKANADKASRQQAQQDRKARDQDRKSQDQAKRQQEQQQRTQRQEERKQADRQRGQQKSAERQKRQDEIKQRQQAQKAQRDRGVKQKAVAEQRSKQRQAASKHRLTERSKKNDVLKADRLKRQDLRKKDFVQNRQKYVDRRNQWRDRPRLNRVYARSARFWYGGRYYADGWWARRWAWSPWRAWRFGYVAAFVPWAGPVFWPYVYDDVFSYTFFPASYDLGYWSYAYDDLVDSAYYPAGSSYAEDDEAPAPAPEGAIPPPRQRTSAVEATAGQSGCGGEITAWPIDKIRRAVQPTPAQDDLLDALRESAGDAAAILKDACPTTKGMTPPERMQATAERLEATLEAVKTVRPALTEFYDALNDDQQSRFTDALAPKVQSHKAQEQSDSRCSDSKSAIATFPTQQLEEALKPNEDQQFLIDDLEAAATKAVELLQKACPRGTPDTPAERLAVMEERLSAMAQAAKIVQPAVEDLYAALNDDQKARYNALGRQASL